NCCHYQNATNYPKYPIVQRCRRSDASRPCWFGDPITAWKYIDQCNGNLPYFLRKWAARTGKPQEQSGQLLDRISLGQTREATRFVPRIEIQLSECRDRTQWN